MPLKFFIYEKINIFIQAVTYITFIKNNRGVSVVCNNCGSELPEGSQFCHKCGTKVEVSNNQSKDAIQDQVINPTPQTPVISNIPKPRKLGLPVIIAAIGIIIVLIISISAFSIPAIQVTTITQEQNQVPYQETITAPVQVAYQETNQVPYQVPYQDTTQNQVNLKYDSSYTWDGSGIIDWGIDVVVTITNIDTEEGTFVATVNYYNGSTLKTTQSKSVTLRPGEKQDLAFRDASFDYHLDWKTRYNVQVSITPGQRTVTSSDTKYKTEYRTEVVTKYRTENQTQVVTKYRTENKDVYNNKTVTIAQYLTGNC